MFKIVHQNCGRGQWRAVGWGDWGGIHWISIWSWISNLKKKIVLKDNYWWGGGSIQTRDFMGVDTGHPQDSASHKSMFIFTQWCADYFNKKSGKSEI